MESRRYVGILVVLALGACSTPSDHATFVDSFSTTAGKAQDAMIAFDSAAADRLTERTRRKALLRPVGVRALPGTCVTSASACTVVLRNSPSDPDPLPLTYTTLLPNHIAAMQEITLYGAALKEIIEVDSTAEVKAAVDKATAAVIGLAGTASIVAPGAGAGVAAFAVPVGQAVVWVVGKYQDHIKLAALRSATERMQEVLPAAMQAFSRAATVDRQTRLARLSDDYDAADATFRTARNEASLVRLLDVADDFDAVLKARPAAVFEGIAKVHDDLHASLHDANIDLATAYARINRLAAEVESLLKLAESFSKAGKSLQESRAR